MEIVENFLKNVPADQKVLFDGLPRKLIQKETFDALIEKVGRQIIGLQIIVPEEKTINRLIKRAEIEKRADDTSEGIRNRIATFYQETVPVIEKYKAEGKLLEVNGDQEIEQVNAEIMKTLSTYFSK
jgi:adenylate kinase family enzyme